MLDQILNFCVVVVSTGYNDTDTSIVLKTGDGAKLPDPASGEYNLTWYDSDTYPNPADDPNVEIDRVTAKSTDTITVIRAQEGTVASTKNTADKTYKMILSLTKKMITDIEARLLTAGEKTAATRDATNAQNGLMPTAVKDGYDDAVTKKHTQGSDTDLGAQAEDLDMNTHKITGVVNPVSDQDAETKKHVADTYAPIATPTLTGQATIPTINLTGGQIKFPATAVPSADPNTQDDYEEGDWTGAFTVSTSGTITIDSAIRTGAYTKKGREVSITGYFRIDSVSSPVGFSYLTGLPFACGIGNKFWSAVNLYVHALDTGAVTTIMSVIGTGASRIEISKFSAVGFSR